MTWSSSHRAVKPLALGSWQTRPSLGLTLTFRDKNRGQTGCPRHHVGRSPGVAAADAINGEDDEEGGWELHQGGVEEVQVDVAPCEAHVHDEALVEDRAGEPGQRGELGSGLAGAVTGRGASGKIGVGPESPFFCHLITMPSIHCFSPSEQVAVGCGLSARMGENLGAHHLATPDRQEDAS